jgi:hypothetical protein
MRRILGFISRVIGHVVKSITRFIKETISNIEATSILIFSSIGAAAVIAEIPFHYTVPLWIESTMVPPLLGLLTIILLLKIMKWRGAI